MRNICFCLVVLLLTACERNEPPSNRVACGVRDPARNLPWLRQRIETLAAGKDAFAWRITMITFQREPLFHIYAQYESCYACSLYRCDGSLFNGASLSPAERNDLLTQLSHRNVVIWEGRP